MVDTGSGVVVGTASSGSTVTGARLAKGLVAEELGNSEAGEELDGEEGLELFSSNSDFSSQVIVLDR